MPLAWKFLSLVCALTALLSGCATGVSLTPFENETRTWPEAPELKRIAFVAEFSKSSDLGIKGSAWSRLISFAAGARDDAMVRPMDVAVTSEGNIVFVADPDAQCVHRYDIARARYTCLRVTGGMGPLSPIGLAVTGDGWLFVSDSQLGRLFRAAPNSKGLELFKVSAELQQPTGMHWDPASGRLFVTDTGKQSVFVFDRNGELLQTISERGSLPGQFNFPTYLWTDANKELLVTDTLNFRVQRFDSEGVFLRSFGENGDRAGEFARPKGIATDSLGHIYVIDALFHSMQIFNREGEFLISVGEQGQDRGQFWLPNGIFVTPDNTIFVADSYNKRIQVFRYVGPEP